VFFSLQELFEKQDARTFSRCASTAVVSGGPLWFTVRRIAPRLPEWVYRQALRWYILPVVTHLETLMAKELKKKRDEAKQAWENATVVMQAKNADDFTGSRKAHDEAERLRVKFLMAEKASEADSDDENTLAMSAHR